MSVHVNVNGVWKTVSAISIRKSGAWKLATGFGIKKSDAWKLALGTWTPSSGDLAASITDSPVVGSRSGAGSVTSDPATVTVVPASGTGPYTYLWTKISGATFTINTPTAAATTFTTTLANAESLSGDYKCTITDAIGTIVEKTVTVNMIASDNPPLTITITNYGSYYSAPWEANLTTIGAGASGGNGSYTYLWTIVGTSPGGNTSTYPQNQSPPFTNGSYQFWMYDTSTTGYQDWLVTATDTNGRTGSKTVRWTPGGNFTSF